MNLNSNGRFKRMESGKVKENEAVFLVSGHQAPLHVDKRS